MTSLKKFFALGAVLVASASVASATPIVGSVAFVSVLTDTLVGGSTPTGVVFNGPQTVSLATDDLAGFTGTSATIENFSFNSSVDGTTLYLDTTSGQTLKFVVDSITVGTLTATNGSMTGTGEFYLDGYTPTEGSWSFSYTDSGLNTFGLSSTAIAATPEPSSLMLLGSGLVSAGGMLFRRRRA